MDAQSIEFDKIQLFPKPATIGLFIQLTVSTQIAISACFKSVKDVGNYAQAPMKKKRSRKVKRYPTDLNDKRWEINLVRRDYCLETKSAIFFEFKGIRSRFLTVSSQ
jgi:hypothetical protein